MATIDNYEDAVTRLSAFGTTYTVKEAREVEKYLQTFPTPMNGKTHKWIGIKTGIQWHFINP